MFDCEILGCKEVEDERVYQHKGNIPTTFIDLSWMKICLMRKQGLRKFELLKYIVIREQKSGT